ncbi:MAG: M23 family metallopeptidase [Prochlorococcaceae cyanobacterium]
MRVRQPIALEDLARQLEINETGLARLNEVNEDHQFNHGDWLVVSSQQTRRVKLLASLDTSELRRSAPLQQPPPPQETGTIRVGDTLARIAHRYGLTLHDLIRLNPGLEAARLIAGTQVRLAQAGSGQARMVLGLAPVGSGGLSWPQAPSFGNTPKPFDGSNSSADWIWPTKGVFTSGYGWRWGRMHRGIDVANNVGTPIQAVKDGEVLYSGWHDGGYGYFVELRHADGTISRYAHNSRLLVKVGEQVRQGTTISLMGSTGRSTGPHLHFEIHYPGKGALNPLEFLPSKA